MTTTARDEILARVRNALHDVPAQARNVADTSSIPRDYLITHIDESPQAMTDLLARNLADYRATVHHCTDAETELPPLIARLLAEHGTESVVTPPGLPDTWLSQCTHLAHKADTDAELLDARALDHIDSVITGCALAIAETGTIVLDGSPDQGRRALTLVPDHHVCIIRTDRIVASVARALPRLDPRRPLTWISGPSATSDIEFSRVEGVHGPRTLDAVIVEVQAHV
ncbi:MAG TPA: LUD domain-containing protein [Actinocrinis sp.]